MSTALEQMIHRQADEIEAMGALDLSGAAATVDAAERVVFVGTGSSQHAAELGVLLFEAAGRDARWLSSAAAARWSAAPRTGDVVVLISHTARTAFVLRTRAAALAANIPIVSIVGRGRGEDWPEAIHTVDPEKSETYTVSYTAAVAVLAGLAGALGGTDTNFAGTAAAVRAVLADPGIDAVPVPARALAIIGSGPWGLTAREGALKLREGARMLAEGFEAERFLHGFAVPYTAADGLILLEPSADPDGLVAALGDAARIEALPVSVLEGHTDGLGPVLAQIPATVRLQLLAERFARLRGQNPDSAIVGAWNGTDLWRIGTPSD